MSVAVADLLERVSDAGLVLIPNGERLRVRGEEPMPEDLLEELRQQKPAVLAELCQQWEREREAAAADYWHRLADLHARAGGPSADLWLTDGVREAGGRSGSRVAPCES